MNTESIHAGLTSEAWDALQAALARLSVGVRDSQAARRSRERMDSLREANRKRLGVHNLAVDLIRQARDSR